MSASGSEMKKRWPNKERKRRDADRRFFTLRSFKKNARSERRKEKEKRQSKNC